MLVQRLDELDRSSTGFPEQLNKLLHDNQWVTSLELLQEDELRELISELNDILNDLDPTGEPFRKCLRVLQKICRKRAVLPATYEVSGELLCGSAEPFAFGGFCDAFQGHLGLEDVCVKRLRISSSGNRELVKQLLCKEAVVWKHLNHANIVSFRGVTFEPLQLVSEWMPGGELKEYIKNNRRTNLVKLLLDIAKGLHYLHSLNVIHADLKGANIVVDETGQARIVDFGLATVARDSESLASTTEAGGITPRFTAPEILKNAQPHTKESDVFAFGMVVIEAFTGRVPFNDCIAATAMAHIMTGVRPERPAHIHFTDDLWALTQRCWAENPQDRPRMDLVVERLRAYDAPQSISIEAVYPHNHENSPADPSTIVSPLENFGDTTLFLLFPPFPTTPGFFFGRDSILGALIGLAERSASVALYGAGGAGKTAIALTFLRHNKIVDKFGKHRYFMRCDALENSLDGFLQGLSNIIGAHRSTDVAQLLSHLEGFPSCALVLDGIDSILDPKALGAAEITGAIEELSRCQKIFLLATSRMDIDIPDFHPMKVPMLPVEAARDTFHSCCRLERSATVDSLLVELDFHPLSITLLASAASENNWDEPALLEAWNKGKTSILKAPDHQSLEELIESILRAPTIQELGTTAQETLWAIAAFPGDPIQEIRLLKTFPKIKGIGNGVNALCKFSLLYRQGGFVKMLSPFRLYFHTQYIQKQHKNQSGVPLSAKFARFGKKIFALFRAPGEANPPNRTQDQSANIQPIPLQQTSLTPTPYSL